MFSVDHKAGIMAAATALRHLSDMKHFSPQMASAVLEHVVQLGEDFRLQAPATRMEIYGLVERLVGDQQTRSHLQQASGSPGAFMLDLLQLCHNERDPKNLVAWFGILKLFLGTSSVSPEVAEKVFEAYADYFPISMRSSANPSAVTVDDLKSALRACFSASYLTAGSAFDFLLKKLDQGDAVTMTVKVREPSWGAHAPTTC